MNIAILGGTGKEGAGLGARWALAGHAIVIGSRDAGRAKTKAAELRELTQRMPIMGESNVEAARLGEVVVIALPAAGLAATLPEVRDGCRGKVVVSTVVPLTFGGPRLFTPPPRRRSPSSAARSASAPSMWARSRTRDRSRGSPPSWRPSTAATS